MGVAQNPQPQASPAKVAGVVSFYMTAALVMVFVNKAVLNTSPDLPLLFLLVQLAIAVALLHGAALASPRVDLPRLDPRTACRLAPVVLVNIVGLVFSTLCLRDVDASFFQIARGMVLPLTILVSSLHTHTVPSPRVLAAAALVTLGFLLGVAPIPSGSSFAAVSLTSTSAPSSTAEGAAAGATAARALNPSLLSLTYGLLSSLFIALHSVLIKSSLPHCGGSTIQLAYWTNLGSALALLPGVLLRGEPARVGALLGDPAWDGRVFAWGCAVTGVFGFLLCVAGLLSIKVTSPITHMFSSAARSVIQTLLGVWLFGDLLTVNRATSILVILLGTMYYTWVKHGEAQAPRAPVLPTAGAGAGGGYMRLPTLEEVKSAREREREGAKGRLSTVREAEEVVFDLDAEREKGVGRR